MAGSGNDRSRFFDQTLANAKLAREEIDRVFEKAHQHNDALDSGALRRPPASRGKRGRGHRRFAAEPRRPAGVWDLLNADPTGTMARLQIPSIDLDLLAYHDTSDATLLKGVGHLQGTSLPVGGEGTRAVLTGNRGLASATVFTPLDKVKVGDTFSVDVLGEVFSPTACSMTRW